MRNMHYEVIFIIYFFWSVIIVFPTISSSTSKPSNSNLIQIQTIAFNLLFKIVGF